VARLTGDKIACPQNNTHSILSCIMKPDILTAPPVAARKAKSHKKLN
jgi:hypothetical protein